MYHSVKVLTLTCVVKARLLESSVLFTAGSPQHQRWNSHHFITAPTGTVIFTTCNFKQAIFAQPPHPKKRSLLTGNYSNLNNHISLCRAPVFTANVKVRDTDLSLMEAQDAKGKICSEVEPRRTWKTVKRKGRGLKLRLGQIPNGPNNRIKTSAAIIWTQQYLPFKCPLLRQDRSFHFHANGVTHPPARTPRHTRTRSLREPFTITIREKVSPSTSQHKPMYTFSKCLKY